MATDVVGTGLPWIDEIGRSFPRRPFAHFHGTELPRLVAAHGHLVAHDLRDASPLAFRSPDGATWSWHPAPEGLRVAEGDAGATTVVELDEQTFSDFVNELLTASGAVRTGRARVVRGELSGWHRWEPALRALCDGRAIYSSAVWETLVDRHGDALDLNRSFAADDDPEVIREFLETAGYVHIRSVFDADEVARYGAEVELCRARTTPGDPYSWWSVNAAGDEVVTRINYLGRHSALLQELAHDHRLSRFARLVGPDLRVCDDRLDGPMVFVKHANVVKGNGDLGWHVDDGIGGHPVMCPLVQAGIQLDHANAANGQLLVLAGSHRFAKHWLGWGDEDGLPVVALETRPGDLTLHFGDAMHTTPPPTSPVAGRRALYYKFAEPKTFAWVPAGCHYNDALFRSDADGRVANRATTWTAPAAY